MKKALYLLSSSMIVGLALGGGAMAGVLNPGQYSLGGFQQICVTGTSWYGTTFSAWGGSYTFDGTITVLYGNYAAGAGNDNIHVAGNLANAGKADWTEWRDDLSFQNFLDDIKVSFVKTICDPPAAAVNHAVGNPLAGAK